MGIALSYTAENAINLRCCAAYEAFGTVSAAGKSCIIAEPVSIIMQNEQLGSFERQSGSIY